MHARTLHRAGEQRTIAIVLETGDETMACLTQVAQKEGITAAQFTAIGAFASATLGYFDWRTKQYQHNPISEQLEVASLTGDIALGLDGKPSPHVHCVLGRRDGSAVAGHLIKGQVRPTLEVILRESPGHLRKKHDPESGLALIDPEA